MKKLISFLFAFSLVAADFWQSKPFTEWNDKEVHRILTSSPWAREVTVEQSAPAALDADGGARGRGDGLGNRPPGLDAPAGPGVMPADAGDPDRARRTTGAPDQFGAEPRSLTLTVRWQSALPLRQALARSKYGAEAATSPDAKKFLDDNSTYVIAVAGLSPALVRTNLSGNKDNIKRMTSLTSKGKDAVQPSDVVLNPQDKLVDVVFVFPKTAAYTLDDKEVEFSTKLGALVVKYKFRLKDMLFNGTLAL